MKVNIHHYESENLTVEYDKERCIHAAECVKSLSAVFDTDKKPWIQPENADPDRIREVIYKCPTGALKYREAETDEPAEPSNAIIISPDGPVYLRGNIEIRNAEDETLLKDTRVALCRCGQSQNKPLCDNSHSQVSFRAPASFAHDKLQPAETAEEQADPLIIKLMKNGPALVSGLYHVYSIADQPVVSTRNIALCRCGGSSTKPFCDGTHKEIDFTG